MIIGDERRKKILEKIEKVESQITLLNDLKGKLVNGLDDPHNIPLAFPQNSLEKQKMSVIPIVITERINLFRSLFRGRDDVYARLWVSRKTGKSGYSPVCKNEWVHRICQKPEFDYDVSSEDKLIRHMW